MGSVYAPVLLPCCSCSVLSSASLSVQTVRMSLALVLWQVCTSWQGPVRRGVRTCASMRRMGSCIALRGDSPSMRQGCARACRVAISVWTSLRLLSTLTVLDSASCPRSRAMEHVQRDLSCAETSAWTLIMKISFYPVVKHARVLILLVTTLAIKGGSCVPMLASVQQRKMTCSRIAMENVCRHPCHAMECVRTQHFYVGMNV